MTDTSVTELLDNLRKRFLEDLPEQIHSIEDNILSAEYGGSYDELFRMVHSLKGSAGSYSFHIITKIAHHLEDTMLYFFHVNKFNTTVSINILLEYVDLLKSTVKDILNNVGEYSHIEVLLTELNEKSFKRSYDILIVEPSKSYSYFIEKSLDGLPVKLTFVADGLSALENLLIKKYSLLITSMEMPPLNADALIVALRFSYSVNKEVDALLITSYEKEKIKNYDLFSTVTSKKVVTNGKLEELVKAYLDKAVH